MSIVNVPKEMPEHYDWTALFPKGEEEFEVLKCEQKVSKTSGNDMLVVELGIKEHGAQVRDWVVLSQIKLQQFLKCLGLDPLADFETENIIGLKGRGRFVEGLDLDEEPCMKIRWYIPKSGSVVNQSVTVPEEQSSDGGDWLS